MIMFLPVLLLQIINALAFQMGAIAVFVIQLAFYLINGMLAANFHVNRLGGRVGRGGIRRGRASAEMNREGMTAGIVLGVLTLISYAIISAIWGMTFGIAAWTVLAAIALGLLNIVFSMLVAMLGAWLYDRVFA